MKVRSEDLEGTQVERLVVTNPMSSDRYRGECVGYLCPECRQADETLEQIWHEDDCSLAGEHGRQYYETLSPTDNSTPEFDPANEFYVIESAETEGRGGLCKGEVLGFVCTCGNADEDLFEIVHDESCALAGRHQRQPSVNAQ